MANKYTYYTCRALPDTYCMVAPEGGSPYIKVRLRIVDGPLAGEERTFISSLSSNETAQRITAESLRALGWNKGPVTEPIGLGEINARVGLRMETYKGTTREKVAVFALEKRVEGLTQEQKAAFDKGFAHLASIAAPVERGEHNKPSEMPERVETRTAPAQEEQDNSMPF